ncbi:hypothetical protein ACR6HW_06560 [Fusibacter sp. JL298sf-3]
MTKTYSCITDYFESTYDLNSIQTLPITDKFRLIQYIKLVGSASDVAREKDIAAITKSPYYEMDPTFHLLISLIASGISEEIVSEVVDSYAHHFGDSAVFRAKLIILGSGALMIQRGIDTESILSYLVSLLGNAFLKDNYERIYREKDALDLTGDNIIDIKYRDFDYTYRKLKYDLLALLKMRRELGYDKVKEIVFSQYDNTELRFYFKLLDLKNKPISEHLYCKLMKDSPKMDRFLLTAVRCILDEMSIVETHYLLNAVIGKYTRFDKPYSEVIEEIRQRETEILSVA